MLKCFYLNPKNLLQIAKTFLGNNFIRNKTSFFIGSTGRIELDFRNTAGYFPLKVWKKIWIWKVRKKAISFEFFIWTLTRQFGEPSQDFLAELLNVFPSLSKQICEIVTNPKKNFSHTIWPPDMLNAVLKVLFFFRWMSKVFFLKILKQIEIDSLFQ